MHVPAESQGPTAVHPKFHRSSSATRKLNSAKVSATMPCDVSTPGPGLFPELEESDVAASRTGVLPSQDIRELIAANRIAAGQPIGEEQIQPASLDLRLGEMAHRVQASFLPGSARTVAEG